MDSAFRRRRIIIASIVTALLAAAVGANWWFCERNAEIAFLPGHSGGEWIIQPKPPENVLHHARTNIVFFRRAFSLNSKPAKATLSVYAFKSAQILINGQAVVGLKDTAKNWKAPAQAEIASLLQAGTNDILVCVTNTPGPPALWLRMQTDELALGTDNSWQVSPDGDAWQAAWPATQRPEIPHWSPIYTNQDTLGSLRRAWPILVIFCTLALGFICGARHLSKTVPPAKLLNLLLVIIVIARAALFINDLPHLPRWMGFDAADHEKYIQFIAQKRSLPLPSDGWEMYQPPLYYGGSALLLAAGKQSIDDDHGEILLHTVNGIVGLFHCWLALLCLRLLFRENYAAQAVGLLLAAFLPPHLYLSQYVTNEPLAGLFVTLAFYFFLRWLKPEANNSKLAMGIGLALGAAMLCKVSALLALLVILPALGFQWFSQKNFSAKVWLRSVGLVLIMCLMVCGWYYGWIWSHFGRPIVGNWESGASSEYWQYPGFHTGADFLHFGQCFRAPLFSGFYSVGDCFYSTLWGDGLVSGMSQLLFRPPWNYDLMNAGYLLAIPISLLAAGGFICVLLELIRQPSAKWFATIGLIVVFGLAIIHMTLRVPFYSESKAFYGFPVLVPFSALVASGWNWLAQKNRIARTVLWVMVLAWALTACTTFWIRNGNAETWRLRGICQLREQQTAEAVGTLTHAAQMNPNDAPTHSELAAALVQQNQMGEAVQQYEEALRLQPDSIDALNILAQVLANNGKKKDTERAVELATRACELTNFRQADPLNTLASAQASAGQREEAIVTSQSAFNLALNNDDASLLDKCAATFNNLVWELATDPDASHRDGRRAVQLALRACEQTEYKKTFLLGTLAAAYAEAGQFDSAVATAQRACDLAAKNGDTDLFQANQALLERYRAHQTARE